MRGLKIFFIFLIGFIVIGAAIGYGWLRSSLPQVSGEITLDGITNAVTVARDNHGIPHIIGNDDFDIAFATGFVHAQDRLWQMESNRRIGHGRLAEILGEPVIGFDRYFRTLGFTGRAQSAYDNLNVESKKMLQAYAAGVNAFIENNKSALPPEFLILGVTPEPWKPVDTMVWQKMMWLDLSGNMRHELARAELFSKFTPEQIRSLYPPYNGDEETPFPNLREIYSDLNLTDVVAALPPTKPEGYGSNNWVISGEHTKSGKPLLANDPHLGLTTPSIWYLARLHNTTTGRNTVGVTFPGSPSIVLGRNDKIAWGFTNVLPDSQDVFVEKLLDNGQYLTPDGPADFIIRKEIIKVKDGEDITLDVRETRHGPVISDIAPRASKFFGEKYVLAMQWTALGDKDTGVTGLLKLGRAQNFEEFKAAGTYYYGPEQNMVYADTDGNIGYYAPALVPVRKPDNAINGRLPSPGWDEKYDWQGYIPYDELPTRENPEGGIIATANEKIVDNDYPHFINRDWALPYRGNRIRAELKAKAPHDLASFAALQDDYVSDMARDVKPWFIHFLDQDDDRVKALAGWDGAMGIDLVEPLIFHTWTNHYQELLLKDEFGEMYDSFRRINPRLIKSSLYWSIETPSADNAYYALEPIDRDAALAWCDNKNTTDTVETCGMLARQAFEDTISDLTAKHGSDWKQWKWGNVHILTQSHRPFSQVDGIKDYFEIKAPVNGSTNTINVAGNSTNPNSLHVSGHGPSYRGLFDMNDLEKSLYIQPTGQSGNPFSHHYSDLFPYWLKTEFIEIKTSKTIPENAEDILTLTPKTSGE
ncbi:penicillin acylase family protein [Kordiimonas sp. SCSIO 12610]|uniref:penicillin acylase family protein n=1 Tax=Kordiimonas sp. SCSIO 12610 TaxID=2829597 RepID=UPI00210B0DEC|nr:penicillin acylase family protein [Kordiimonas sp. SCSIO 12610]UTW56683.1 penicillin acylase family protein [Kordiimonas sp. SCSIO 12610]